MNRLLVVAAAMVAVAGVGGVATLGAAMAAKRPQGLDACTSASARAGLRDAILTRIAAKGGEVDAGYALSLDTPRLESVDFVADRTVCGGTARLSVPEHRRAALDGVSELSDPVRFMIEPGRGGAGTVVALVGGGDRIADWLGAPPAPPAPPSPALLRADYAEVEDAAVEGGPVEAAIAPTPEPAAPVRPAVVPPRRTEAASPRPAARPIAPVPAPRQPIRVATPRAAPAAPPAPRAATPTRPATSRAPSSTTSRLNAGVSTTSRLNAPVARSGGRDGSPVPVSSRSVDRPPPPPPSGPSFDCRRSRNPAERAICDDDRLARMDVRMARRYVEAQASLGPRAAAELRAEQLEWLRRRDDCDSRRCLEIMYDTRAARLDRMN